MKKGTRPVAAIRSVLFNLFFYSWSFVFLTLCLPVIFGPPRSVYLVGQAWAYVTLHALRISYLPEPSGPAGLAAGFALALMLRRRSR